MSHIRQNWVCALTARTDVKDVDQSSAHRWGSLLFIQGGIATVSLNVSWVYILIKKMLFLVISVFKYKYKIDILSESSNLIIINLYIYFTSI